MVKARSGGGCSWRGNNIHRWKVIVVVQFLADKAVVVGVVVVK
jgi:hypothetical protein